MSEVSEDGTVILDNPKDIKAAQMLARRIALETETFTQLRMSRGMSVYAMVKREHNLKGNKRKVFDAYNKIVTEKTGIAWRPLPSAKRVLDAENAMKIK